VPESIELVLHAQGCNKPVGICYPPQIRNVVAPVTELGAETTSTKRVGSQQDTKSTFITDPFRNHCRAKQNRKSPIKFSSKSRYSFSFICFRHSNHVYRHGYSCRCCRHSTTSLFPAPCFYCRHGCVDIFNGTSHVWCFLNIYII